MSDSIPMRGICVNVDYSDLASICLPQNLRHLTECWVVTSPDDTATQHLCAQFPNVRTYITNEFYLDGAYFNKGRAMESALRAMPHDQWIAIFDADILFPEDMSAQIVAAGPLMPDTLYGARRRIVENPLTWNPSDNWMKYPLSNDSNRVIGYLQIFDPRSPVISDKSPWYDQTFIHAGGGDGHFERLYPRSQQKLLPFDVLHLGPRDKNWFGRTTPRLDGTVPIQSEHLKQLVKRYHHSKGWCGMSKSGESFCEKISSSDVIQTDHECL